MIPLLKASAYALRLFAHLVIYPVLESFWAALCAVARIIIRPKASEIVFSGHDRVLVVAPHPDDETLGCGGTIVNHTLAGDHVHVLIVTDGGASRAGGRPRSEMTRLRALEARRAIARLHPDVEITLGSLPEGQWHDAELHSLLRSLLHELRPTVIYAPSCVDFHPEHLAVANGLADVLSDVPYTPLPRIRVYELQVPLSAPLINCTAQIGHAKARKDNALSEYHTQRASFEWQHRQQRYLRIWLGTQSAVEVFMEMTAPDYVCMMNRAPSLRPTFRSLRNRPFTDGFAWLVGIVARIRLRRGIEAGAIEVEPRSRRP